VRIDEAFLSGLDITRAGRGGLNNRVLLSFVFFASPLATLGNAGGVARLVGQSGLAFRKAAACASFAIASDAISGTASSTASTRACASSPAESNWVMRARPRW
jgi:hypothetical protein